jgi:hypothetical protein
VFVIGGDGVATKAVVIVAVVMVVAVVLKTTTKVHLVDVAGMVGSVV